MIQPFKIINDDGTTNQEEYNRCIEFLNNYVNGSVPVSGKLVWANPFEINEDNERSSLEILIDEIYNSNNTGPEDELVTNRLLTANCFNQFKRFFRGFVKGISRTLQPSPAFYANSKFFTDGPGYYYDPLTSDNKRVIVKQGHLPYIDDGERETLSINLRYSLEYELPTEISSDSSLGQNVRPDEFPNTNFSNWLASYPAQITCLFQRLIYSYKQSNIYFYYSKIDDKIINHGTTNYFEDRLNRTILPTMFGTGSTCNIGKGFDLTEIRNIIDSNLNSYGLIKQSYSKTSIPNPTLFDCYNTEYNQTVFGV